jgi:hypothetical protein
MAACSVTNFACHRSQPNTSTGTSRLLCDIKKIGQQPEARQRGEAGGRGLTPLGTLSGSRCIPNKLRWGKCKTLPRAPRRAGNAVHHFRGKIAANDSAARRMSLTCRPRGKRHQSKVCALKKAHGSPQRGPARSPCGVCLTNQPPSHLVNGTSCQWLPLKASGVLLEDVARIAVSSPAVSPPPLLLSLTSKLCLPTSVSFHLQN